MVKDPICGMEIDPAAAVAKRSIDGSDYYFCSEQCDDGRAQPEGSARR